MALIVEEPGLLDADLAAHLNVFAGAGFSTLARNSEHNLVTGDRLKALLINHFNLKTLTALSLSQIYSYCEANFGDETRAFIVKEFTVVGGFEVYEPLRKLSLSHYYTTNVDDLPFYIFGPRPGESTKVIHDNEINGAPAVSSDVVQYISLHGSIRHTDRPLVFTDGQIASAFASDQETWYVFQRDLSTRPTFFLGYSIADAGVLQAMQNASVGRPRKWLLLRNPDPAYITLYKSLGYHIVLGEISDFIKYIDSNTCIRSVQSNKPVSAIGKVPASGETAQRPVRNFFIGAEPTWSDAYSNQVVRRREVDKIQDLVFSGKNVVLVGLPLSGKSTIIRQAAADLSVRVATIFFEKMSLEVARELIAEYAKIDTKPVILIDNFIDSKEAIRALIASGHFRIVSTETSFYFDSVNLKSVGGKFDVLPCSEVDPVDLQKILRSIPPAIRRRDPVRVDDFGYSVESRGLFEALERNVFEESLRSRYSQKLKDFEKVDKAAFDVFIMACYAAACRIVVSFEMIYMFVDLKKKDYAGVYGVIARVNEFLLEIDDENLPEQDYFSVRSTALARVALSLVHTAAFERVFDRFHRAVPKRIIVDFATFRRYGYDNDFARKAFKDVSKGERFYTKLLFDSDNPYDYQHAAVYMSKMGDFKKAFDWIDTAITKSGGRLFPIRNSHAVILFDANITFFRSNPQDSIAADGLTESMIALQKCVVEDNRRSYHLLRFADQAVQIFEIARSPEAADWLLTARDKLREALFSAQKPGSRESYNTHKFRRLLATVEQALD